MLNPDMFSEHKKPTFSLPLHAQKTDSYNSRDTCVQGTFSRQEKAEEILCFSPEKSTRTPTHSKQERNSKGDLAKAPSSASQSAMSPADLWSTCSQVEQSMLCHRIP